MGRRTRRGMFPGLLLVGLAGGLAQAPLFAAADTLAPERTTTGSAVLNMSRQIGSAIGVAAPVALTAQPTLTGFDHAWWVQAGAMRAWCRPGNRGRPNRGGAGRGRTGWLHSRGPH
ncbi:hypothetical protein [Streptomyces sp. NPDC002088]|uniref:hypothetical protein n=1 Tax=Streptomyces sp. NPDC002088 TaxID=3154665 RepID=UPI0033344C54